MAFVVPGGTEAVSISVWDQQANADAYARGTYPQVLKAVANVVEGTPQVDIYEVSNSTFHKIAARVAV
jgi:heme-degrading monooxygenase HmoA